MKNIKKITYLDIKRLLNANDINPISNFNDNDCFTALNSLKDANESELTFFNDASQLKILEKTKAKACLINLEKSKLLPKNTQPIIVDDVYKAFSILTDNLKELTTSL